MPRDMGSRISLKNAAVNHWTKFAFQINEGKIPANAGTARIRASAPSLAMIRAK
jgi:hypothetical protein